ncbi:hypothetical protein [Desulfothermus sp.]
MKVVVNSTPLIALSLVNKLSILKELFDEVIIPCSVFEEITIFGKGKVGSKEVKAADWLTILSPQEKEIIPSFLLGLDKGELDVILLAKEIDADMVLIDEKAGRKVAKAIKVKVKGTLGLLLMAYHKCIINKTEAENILKKLDESFLRISPNLISWFKKELKI